MNMIFKKISALLITGAIFTGNVCAFAEFADMPNDLTRPALENAVKNGLLTGYDTGEIKPYDKITRAQMGTILVRAMNATNTADLSSFADMKKEQWFYDSMSKAVAMGIFKGDGQNLNPEANITFQEAFVVLSRLFDLKSHDKNAAVNTSVLDKYTDKDLVADWALADVVAIIENNYWAGGNTLRPTEYINRAEFAVLMDNLVNVYIDESGTYDKLPEGKNVLVRSDNANIVSFTNGNIFIGDAVNKTVIDNSIINKAVVRGGELSVQNNSAVDYVNLLNAGTQATKDSTSTINHGWGVKGSVFNLGTISQD